MSAKLCNFCQAEIVYANDPAGRTRALEAAATTMWIMEGAVGIGESKCRPVQVRKIHRCPNAGAPRGER
jgi:hypothetical protein